VQLPGEPTIVEMRYFTGPESPPSDKGYLLVVERWYVKRSSPRTTFGSRDGSSSSRGTSATVSPPWRPTTPKGSARQIGADSSGRIPSLRRTRDCRVSGPARGTTS
jgi:hypothetical protein